MRHSTLGDSSNHQPTLSDSSIDTNQIQVAQDARNASSAPFCTTEQSDIMPDKKIRTLEIPEFTAIELARFWSRVEIGLKDECWLWKGPKMLASPYSPDIFYGNYLGFKVHRIAYTVLVEAIPEGLTLDHVKARGCTSTLCCNPAHLEPVSMAEQVRRRDGEKSVTRVTLCKWGHVRPIGRKAKCPECNKRFVKETLARRRAEDPEGFRAKQAERRRRQRQAAKATPTALQEVL